MPIRREDLTATGFADAAETGVIPLSTPGELLKSEFMVPLGQSANALAQALHVPTNRITAILNGSRGITADTAFRLARYYGTTPEFWLGLQADYELRSLETADIERDVLPLAA